MTRRKITFEEFFEQQNGRPLRPKLTVTQRLARERLTRNLRAYDDETTMLYAIKEQTPEAWNTLLEDIECFEPKEKVTLWLDKSVAKFFRGMGRGYQGRINRVLATFAQMRIVKVENLERAFAAYEAEEAADRQAEEAARRGERPID